MHKLYRDRKHRPKGDRLWRNPTDRLLGIVIYRGTLRTIEEVKPGATISFPAAWPDKSVANICRFLVRADAEEAPAPKPPAPVAAAPPPPPETEKPLGDPTKVQSESDRKDDTKDASHTSGDSLEAYAQALMKKSKSALVAMATGLGIAVEDSDGKPLSKPMVARAIALKSVEGDDD